MKRSGPRPVLVACLVIAMAFGVRAAWVQSHRAARTIATTTCPFFGDAVVTIVNDLQSRDTMPTRVHEDVHAAQCRQLGPVRYRLRNLTASGRLRAEAPAFCAAAAARMRVDPDSAYANDRLHTDMIEGLSDVADSLAIKRSLMVACPEIASLPRRTRAPARATRPQPR